MAGTDERRDRIEYRLDGVEQQLSGLRDDVQKWRLLQEAQGDQIRLIAEVQAHHGEKLNQFGERFAEIGKALQPLAALDRFVRAVAGDHERRIAALEQGREH